MPRSAMAGSAPFEYLGSASTEALYVPFPGLTLSGTLGVNSDTAATYTERFLMAFDIPFFLVENDGDSSRITTAFQLAAKTNGPVVVLVGDEFHGFNS